jgi:hypothetical protein
MIWFRYLDCWVVSGLLGEAVKGGGYSTELLLTGDDTCLFWKDASTSISKEQKAKIIQYSIKVSDYTV